MLFKHNFEFISILPCIVSFKHVSLSILFISLLQSHVYDNGAYVLQLLPALPAAWPDGEFTGLKARGGFEVSARWQAGRMVELRVKSLLGNDFRVWYDGDYIASGKIGRGKTWVWRSR